MSTEYKVNIKQAEKYIVSAPFDAIIDKKIKVLYTDGTKKIYNSWKDKNKPAVTSGKFKNFAIIFKNSDRYLVCTRNKYGRIGDDITLYLSNNTRIKCRIAAHISQSINNIENASKIKDEGFLLPIDKDINERNIIDKAILDGPYVCLFITKNKPITIPVINAHVVKVVNETLTKQYDQNQSKAREGAQKVSELALTKNVMFKPRDGSKSPSRSEKWYSYPSNPFPYNSSSGGNCTWYAYGRFCEIANQWVKMSRYPNAVFFYDSFPDCKKGSTPKLGAIACWGKGSSSGEPGHVAVVEEIKSNGDIRITESGWTGGWHTGNIILKKSENYCSGWTASGYTFRGFIYNPIEFSDVGVAIGVDNGNVSLDMKKRIETLYSSNNYSYLEVLAGAEKESPIQPLINSIRNSITKYLTDEKAIGSILKNKVEESISTLKSITINRGVINRSRNSSFEMSSALVEAPVITVQIDDIVIGSVKGKLDKYPNYINGLTVRKTNGELNEYKIEIIHQIRVGDDPQLLDKLFSKNQFTPITIAYGDSMTGSMFEDKHAIITNVIMNRDYASSKIIYGVEAISACHYITCHRMNFPAKTDKPSNVLLQLMYHSPMSTELKKAFPSMASENEVMSRGLIPTNDKVVQLKAFKQTDPITYINYLVSSMSNAKNGLSSKAKGLNKSSYFIFYKDTSKGSEFEIREIKTNEASNKFNSIYEVTIGYPYADGNKDSFNNIYSFNITNDKSWAILYDKTIAANKSDEYVYTITNNGDVDKYYSPNIINSSNVMTERLKNWWSFMVGFPITATLTMKGLLRPAFLTNYIKINVVFYGQKHITSGLYAITEQVDTLNGSGFRTSFSLIRVGEE